MARIFDIVEFMDESGTETIARRRSFSATGGRWTPLAQALTRS